MNKELAICGVCGTKSLDCVVYAYCPGCEVQRREREVQRGDCLHESQTCYVGCDGDEESEVEMSGYMKHPDPEVKAAIIRLSDALCTWERATGRESIFIVREQGGFFYRAASGKPVIPDDIPDAEALAQVN